MVFLLLCIPFVYVCVAYMVQCIPQHLIQCITQYLNTQHTSTTRLQTQEATSDKVCRFEEHYVPSLLKMRNLDSSTDCHGELVYMETHPGTNMPHVFGAEDVSQALVEHLRGDGNGCNVGGPMDKIAQSFVDALEPTLENVCQYKSIKRYVCVLCGGEGVYTPYKNGATGTSMCNPGTMRPFLHTAACLHASLTRGPLESCLRYWGVVRVRTMCYVDQWCDTAVSSIHMVKKNNSSSFVTSTMYL